MDEKYNKKLYDVLWKSRALSIEIAQIREIKLWKRLIYIILVKDKIQNLINSSSYDKIDNLIEVLKDIVVDPQISHYLESISAVENVKILFTNTILNMKITTSNTNITFTEFIKEFNEFIVKYKEMINSSDCHDKEHEFLNVITEQEKSFDEYFEDKEFILENYIVYNLYSNYMRALYTKDLHKEIIRLVLSYSIIKKILLGRWSKNNKKLQDEDIVDAIYSFSRALEHDENFIDKIYKNIKNSGYDSMAYLTVLIK